MVDSRDSHAHRLIACVIAFLTLAWFGCSRAGRSLQVEEGYFDDAILSDFRTRTNLTDTMRLQMSVEIATRDEKTEVRQILAYKRPDKFRLQVLDPMNVTRVVVVANGDLLRLFYVREYEGIEAPLRDDVLRRLFRMDIRVSDIRTAIVADPFIDYAKPPTGIERRDGRTVLTRPSARKSYVDEITIEEFDGQTVVKEWRIRPESGGDTEQITRFTDYREIGGVLRPMEVTIERAKDATRLRFRVSEAEMNPSLADASFDLSFPPNAKVDRLQ